MSVFTFDPDPPRVASPWLQPADPGKKPAAEHPSAPGGPIRPDLLSDYGVTKLEAEPQEGPTEYKLHLLLRPRRIFEYMSTTSWVSGSTQSRVPPDLRSSKPSSSSSPSPVPVRSASPSSHTRQDRLEHLTTQLLWRLQQSCPYHTGSAAAELVVPQLPDESEALSGPIKLGKLPPGLEASRGALYEIGVADDGTLVGLARDEMDESLRTLRVMAASLGCNMEVLRSVIVGECQWVEYDSFAEQTRADEPPREIRRQAKLWVTEALVAPDLGPRDPGQDSDDSPGSRSASQAVEPSLPDPKQASMTTNQLRVTLTGPTTAGKSTLLGTLSTGTLDNGRGRSRTNLLKHRHELVSGVTSSVAQEIIGYHEASVVNYAHHGIESWIDIHDYTRDGRLVYLVDSAGHPRYRRTILRGIIGWAPHWTFLCLAADDAEKGSGVGATASAQEILGISGAGVDLASAHLDLCLQLEVPLAIVITKFDLASKLSLRSLLGKLLTSIRKTGRAPKVFPTDESDTEVAGQISSKTASAVKRVTDAMIESGDLLSTVPIVLTSAVRGTGIGLLHALLQHLPLPPPPTPHDYIGPALNPEQPACLFHIEEKFSLPASYSLPTSTSNQQTDLGTVVAGYLRFGNLSIGDKVVIGPFPSEDEDVRALASEDRPSAGSYGLSISHPSSAELSRIVQRNAVSASTVLGEWYDAHIVSIRNLRLPVQSLEAGQVGSIGIIFGLPEEVGGTERREEEREEEEEEEEKEKEPGDGFFESPAPSTPATPAAIPRLRKGMVLAVPSRHMLETGLSLQAASGFTAVFPDPSVVSFAAGSLVNIYIASVRAAARVVRVSGLQGHSHSQSQGHHYDASGVATEDIDDVFNLNNEEGVDGEGDIGNNNNNGGGLLGATQPAMSGGGVEVRLELLASREWIELGSRILLLEGGRRDRSGLEGFVGRVVEIVD